MVRKIDELEFEQKKAKDALVKLRSEVSGLTRTHARLESACARSEGTLQDCGIQFKKRQQEAEALDKALQEEYAACEAQLERDNAFDIHTVSDFTAFCRNIGQELTKPERSHLASEQGERLFQCYPDLAMSELSALKTRHDRLEKTCEFEASRCKEVIGDRVDVCMGVLLELGKQFQDVKKQQFTWVQKRHQLQQTISRHNEIIDEHYKVADQHLVRLDAVRNHNVVLVAEEKKHAVDIRKQTRAYWEHMSLRHASLQDQEQIDSEIAVLTSTLLEVESEARSAAEEARTNEASSEMNVADQSLARSDLDPRLRKLSPTYGSLLKRGRRRSSKLLQHCHPFDTPPTDRKTSQVYKSESATLPPLPEEETDLRIGSDAQDFWQESDLFAEVSEVQAVNWSLTTEIACLREKFEQRLLRNEIETARTRERLEQREFEDKVLVAAHAHRAALGHRVQSDYFELQEKAAEMREHEEEQQWLRSEILDLKRRAAERHIPDQGGADISSRVADSRADGETYQTGKSLGNLQNPLISRWRHDPVALPAAPEQYARLPSLPLQGEDLPTILETPQPLFVWPQGKLPGSPVKEVWATA